MTHSDDLSVLRQLFVRTFGTTPTMFWQAPGRVNLIGEHTDYNGGAVLPCALDMYTTVAIARRNDDRVRLVSDRFPDEIVDFNWMDSERIAQEAHWSRYVPAVFASLQAQGHELGGCDLAVVSRVPDGAGLSSSAALEVAIGSALSDLFQLNLSKTDVAKLGQYAENHYVGCQCGIMDQLASACAKDGHALLLDCRTLETRAVSVPKRLSLVVIHSGIQRGLVDSAYNERRLECEDAARLLNVTHLCEASLSDLERAKPHLNEQTFRRARHVISEHERCLKMAIALAEDDLQTMSTLMYESHSSLRDDFEVSMPDIDRLVDHIHDRFAEACGVRMTGGGFGGCIVVLCKPELVEALEREVLPWYTAQTNHVPRLWQSAAVSGVKSVVYS